MAMAVVSQWVVVEPVANLHAKASPESPVVSQAIYATAVERLDTSGGWVRVRTPDEYEGWIAVAELIERSAPYAADGRVAWVDNLFANVYREPDVTKHEPLLTIPYGTQLEVVSEPDEQERRWIELRLPDERLAWVQRGDVRFDSNPVGAGEAVALARRFVGLPYLWGGTSTFGYDCSGFTQMLCRRRGFPIPRDAAPQARWKGMVVIKRSDLEPGDLVFFGESVEKITHTGMYIGNGEFIHATAYRRPMVQVSRLGDPHWSELLVACRRLGKETQ